MEGKKHHRSIIITDAAGKDRLVFLRKEGDTLVGYRMERGRKVPMRLRKIAEKVAPTTYKDVFVDDNGGLNYSQAKPI